MGEGSTQLLMDITLTLCGIPQGSVLGPTLFSLFVNDLPSSMNSGSGYLFADDVTIYCIKKTADEAVAQLEKALDELYNWCILNRLTPHPQNSEAMLICKTRARGPLAPILIGTDAIEWVNKSKNSPGCRICWISRRLS